MNRLKRLRKENWFSQIKMQMLANIDQSNYSKIKAWKNISLLNNTKELSRQLNTCMDYHAYLTYKKTPYPPKNNEMILWILEKLSN